MQNPGCATGPLNEDKRLSQTPGDGLSGAPDYHLPRTSMSSMKGRFSSLSCLSLWCGTGVLVTINLCYVLAAWNGHVSWCIPYRDGCTSISATGRNLPEAALFKGLMLPLAVLMLVYWSRAFQWLDQWCVKAKKRLISMRFLGILAALLLGAYTIILGLQGELFRNLRHTIVILSFSFTYLSQLLFIWIWSENSQRHVLDPAGRVAGLLKLLCVLILVVGISSVAAGVFYSGYRNIEDAFEWNLALLLNLHFILVHFIWRRDITVP